MDLQDQLRDATLFGDVAEVNRLLDQGASVNKAIDGQLPLCLAISNGEIDVAIHLLRHGADLSLPPFQKIESPTQQLPPSWRTNRWVMAAGRIVIGIGINVGIWQALNHLAVRLPATRILRDILDFGTPLGNLIVFFFVDHILPFGNRRPTFRRGADVGIVMGIFWASRIIRGPLQSVMLALLSWSWKGKLGRVLIDLGMDMAVITCQRLRRSIWKPVVPTYPGLRIVESFINSKFRSESLALALLNHGLFPKEYVIEYESIERNGWGDQTVLTSYWETAVSLGFADVVRRLLSLGLSVDTLIGHWPMLCGNTTALQIAASSGKPCVVKTLLESGANVEGWAPTTGESSFHSTPLINCLVASNRYDEDDSKARHRVLQLLIDSGADVNASNSDGQTPLTLALQNCRTESVKLLLSHGAIPTLPDKQGKTPAEYAVTRTDADELLKLLGEGAVDLDVPDQEGFTPFLSAAKWGEMSAAKRLLSLGANPLAKTAKGETALQLAARYGTGELLEMLLETGVDVNAHDQGTDTALLQACGRHVDRVIPLTLLLNAGADPNIPSRRWKPGLTPLHKVCRETSYTVKDRSDPSDQLDAVRLLVKHGADVNARYTDERMANERDVTPLGLASSNARYKVKADIFKVLLDAGADPAGLNDDGLPALVACAGALEFDDPDVQEPVGFLLDNGADIAARDEERMTCLHHAVENHCFRATISILSRLNGLDHVERDAIVDATDSLDRTPLHIACGNRYWMRLSAYEKWSVYRRSGNSDYANWHVSLESNAVLQALRKTGADPYSSDAYDGTTMHAAAKAGNPRIMAMLLLWTGPGLLYDLKDRSERLAFHYAVLSLEVTRMLLHYHQHGTVAHEEYYEVIESDDSLDDPFTNLKNEMVERVFDRINKRRYEQAHPESNWDVAEANGISRPWREDLFNAADRFGNTPLHYAALAGKVEVVELYLNMPDIDIAARNKDGETALDFASDRQCTLAISEKRPDLRRRKAGRQASTAESWGGDSREEADEFIKRLGQRYSWGVYTDRIK